MHESPELSSKALAKTKYVEKSNEGSQNKQNLTGKT